MGEHKNYIRNNEIQKSKICEYAWKDGHRINWDSAKILTKEAGNKTRKIKESVIILLNEDKCVTSCSVDFYTTWLPMLKEELNQLNIIWNKISTVLCK